MSPMRWIAVSIGLSAYCLGMRRPDRRSTCGELRRFNSVLGAGHLLIATVLEIGPLAASGSCTSGAALIMQTKSFLRPSVYALAVILISAGVAGCGQKKDASAPGASANALALPLTTGPASTIVPAPAAGALPSAPRVRVVRVANQSDNYAYVDRAYAMSNAIGQAPPDYGFDYDGVHPWVWRGSNREVRLIEPVEGGYRYYYYQPGATKPYLVRDPQYSYGFFRRAIGNRLRQ